MPELATREVDHKRDEPEAKTDYTCQIMLECSGELLDNHPVLRHLYSVDVARSLCIGHTV